MGKFDITLSTGRVLKPNAGIVGIGPDLNVYEGYDSEFMYPHIELPDWIKKEGLDSGPGAYEELTIPERIELADIMIARWQAFKERHACKAKEREILDGNLFTEQEIKSP